jgi:hypothetical protein
MHHNTNPAAQILLSAPAAITKLVIAFTIAAVAGVVTGNQSCFALTRVPRTSSGNIRALMKEENRRW